MEIIVGKEFPGKVIPYVNASAKNIDIVVFDWRWYAGDVAHPVSRFNQAIVRAVRRGVAVRAVVNNKDTLSTLQSLGVHAKLCKSKRLLHAKLMRIDDKVLIIGSHNYTQRAFQTNLEISVIIEDDEGFPRITQFLGLI